MLERQALRRQAEQIGATLPPLLVAADRVAAIVSQGVHGRRRVGQGESFWQFRRYEPGDSAQAIDWRQSAKRQRIFVRENEWEAAQSVWLWRDRSASMRYRSPDAGMAKDERADLIVLALASLLVRGGEHIALLGEGLSPSTGQAALERVAARITQMPGEDTDPERSLPRFEPLPRYAQLVLVGDFLAPLPQLNTLFRHFAERDVKGHVLQVLDPAEISLPYDGRRRFEGLEQEGDVLIRRTERIRDNYVARIDAHRAGLADIARSLAWSFAGHCTNRPPETALLSLFTALADELGD